MNGQTAETLVERAIRGGLNADLAFKETAPWTLVMQGAGKAEDYGKDKGIFDVHEWYLEQKPLRDLARLQHTDPERYAFLSDIKAKSEEWHRLVCQKHVENDKQKNWDDKAGWEKFFSDHDELIRASEAYHSFKIAAVSDHRIDDVYGNISDSITGVDLGGYMHYFLLRNEESGEHLSLMIDARHNLRTRERDPDPNFVDNAVFHAHGRSEDQIKNDVQWEWAAHFIHRNRFAPFYDPKTVKSLDEAERLRAKFNGAAHEERPAVGKEVFDFYPAFMRAYGGEDGFFQALVDVYGPQGNVRHCNDMGVAHNHWDHEVYNQGGETGRQYEIDAGTFLRLYEKMGKKDQAAFEAAFNRFVEDILPTVIDDIEDKGNKGYAIAHDIAGAMAYFKIAVEFGTGANEDPHWFDKFQATEHEMLDIAMRTPGRWARHNQTRSIAERAPKF